MDIREVTHVIRDDDGTIQALGNPGKSWSPRSKDKVVDDIDGHVYDYYATQGAGTVEIDTVHPHTYLRTRPDGKSKNNLSSLPDLPEEKDLVGYFKVTSGELIISDPCYRPGSGSVKPAKNGKWRATVETTPEGRALVAMCEDEEPVDGMKIAGFEVGVDSAQAGIFCAGAYPSEKNPKPGFYKACCETPRKSGLNAAIVKHRGVVVGTDDGSYRAFVGQNGKGQAVSIRIEVE
jgi:Protein of unknown function (DUF3892)